MATWHISSRYPSVQHDKVIITKPPVQHDTVIITNPPVQHDKVMDQATKRMAMLEGKRAKAEGRLTVRNARSVCLGWEVALRWPSNCGGLESAGIETEGFFGY